jgi:hypothetical protein
MQLFKLSLDGISQIKISQYTYIYKSGYYDWILNNTNFYNFNKNKVLKRKKIKKSNLHY